MAEMGRPSEYDPNFIQKVEEYLALEVDQDIEVVHKKEDGTYVGIGQKLKVQLPTVEGFALFIDVSKRVLYDWEKLYPEFLHALDKIRTEQQKRLLNKGLSGQYNAVIAKLVLSANHGMREKQDVTSDDKPLGDSLIGLIQNATANKETDKGVST